MSAPRSEMEFELRVNRSAIDGIRSMNAINADVYRRYVTSYLAEDRSQWMRSLREYHDLSPDGAGPGRAERAVDAAAAFFANGIPVLHLWHARRRFITRLLGTMQSLCWYAGFGNGREIEEPGDFHRVLLRWAAPGRRRAPSEPVPAVEQVAAAVSSTLQAAHVQVLALGFLPIVGAVAGMLIEGSMVSSFRRCAHAFYRAMAATGERAVRRPDS